MNYRVTTAFTATPKNKTLELFGEAFDEGGQVKHRPFHSYYKLVKTVEGDPEFDTKRRRRLPTTTARPSSVRRPTRTSCTT